MTQRDGGNKPGSEGHSEGKAEKAESKSIARAGEKGRQESNAGMQEHTENQLQARLDRKELRNQNIVEQAKKGGKADVGPVTREFGCSIEIKDSDKIVVPGRSKEDVATVKQLEQAAKDGLLLADGGRLVTAQSLKYDGTLVQGTKSDTSGTATVERNTTISRDASNKTIDRSADHNKAAGDKTREVKDHTDKGSQPKDKTEQEADAFKDKVAKSAENMKNPGDRKELLQFQEDFEKRVKAGQVNQQERLEVYKQMDRLLNSNESSITTTYERQMLATDIMRYASHPNQLEQHHNNTCNVTTAGERLFERDPAKAAKIMADSAIKGEFTLDGKTIKLDHNSLHPCSEEKVRHVDDGEPRRSYGTQVLNVALTNDITQRRTPPGEYRQEARTASNPSGEHYYTTEGKDASGKPILKDHDGSPAIMVADVAGQNKRLDGDKGTVIMNEAAEKPKDKAHPNDKDVTHIKSPEELKSVLEDAAKHHKLPLIIAVDGYDPALFKDGPNHAEKGHINHVISVTGYHDGKVEIFNPQAAPDTPKNTTISYTDLYRATVPAAEIKKPTH